MKKLVIVLVLALVVAAFPMSTVSAKGGAPALHGVDGQTFGSWISGAAQSAPGAIAEHVSNSGGNGGGMPAAHGVDGKEFGSWVSGAAQSTPGAIAEHVSGK